MIEHSQRVRQARELVNQVNQELTAGGTVDPALGDVAGALGEVPGLLRAVAMLLEQVDPAAAGVILRGGDPAGLLHSPGDRARYVASSLRGKADDVVGVVAKLKLAL